MIVQAYGIDSAPAAQGHVVVIDVLRSFTTAACAFAAGAREILLVADPEEAFVLRRARPDLVLAGEIGGRPIPGFDLGNSPAAIVALGPSGLAGRTLVLRSSSGTQGVVHATSATQVLLGSLVVAGATVRYLRSAAADPITLLAMGAPGGPDGPEDVACACHLATLLRGDEPDVAATVRAVRESPSGRQALDPEIDWISSQDLAIAVEVDRFSFAMIVHREGPALVARAVR